MSVFSSILHDVDECDYKFRDQSVALLVSPNIKGEASGPGARAVYQEFSISREVLSRRQKLILPFPVKNLEMEFEADRQGGAGEAVRWACRLTSLEFVEMPTTHISDEIRPRV